MIRNQKIEKLDMNDAKDGESEYNSFKHSVLFLSYFTLRGPGMQHIIFIEYIRTITV